ncbi:hypothetical protein ACFLVJ_02470 [Chloroflexota bacterium]
MKVLAWYTVIFNALIILALILTGAGVISPAPFSWLENIIWIVLSLPVMYLGIRIIRDYT